MARYVAVIHNWFVDSKGFTVKRFSADSRQEAEDYGRELKELHNSTFNQAAVQIIHIGDKVLLSPRKLTLWERISGNLSPSAGLKL